MEFTDPELQAYQSKMAELIREGSLQVDADDHEIFLLMSMVDRFLMDEMAQNGDLPHPKDQEWEPKTKQLLELKARLLAPENRKALKHWFQEQTHINPKATLFREWLSAASGERF